MEVAVLGTTGDGRSFAGRCALAGHAVHLYDADANGVMDAIDAIESRHGDAVVSTIDGTTGLDAAVGDADVVIDATDGDESTRRKLVADVEELVSDDALVATGGNAVSVTAVAAGLRKPGRAIGFHQVRPQETAVVEVVVADQTTEATRERAVAFVEGLDGTPLVVRDVPGFASARLDLALVVEAIRTVEDGVASVTDVDRTLELGRDHPVGPLAMADEWGLADVLAALDDLANRLDGRFDPPGLLREKVDDGALGVSTSRGFYEYENGERVGPADPNPDVRGRPGSRSKDPGGPTPRREDPTGDDAPDLDDE